MPLMTVSNHDTGSSYTVKTTIWAILGCGLLENDDQTVAIVF
jgi:hypothetical protein